MNGLMTGLFFAWVVGVAVVGVWLWLWTDDRQTRQQRERWHDQDGMQ